MPRPCSICVSERRTDIDTAIVGGVSYRNIAARFGVAIASLARHKTDHLPLVIEAGRAVSERGGVPEQPVPEHAPALVALVAAQEAREQAHAVDVMAEIARIFGRMNKLSDACDAWLTDPEDPTRYTIEPRADEVTVVYLEPGMNGPVRRKAKLSTLLQAVRDGGIAAVSAEHRHADPRKLVIETAGELRGQLELVVDLMERAHNAERLEHYERALLDALGGADATVKARFLATLRSLRATGFAARAD